MKYKYNICATRYGGEHTIGTIDKSVASYWLNRGQDEFEDYMTDWDREEANEKFNVPKKYQLPDWYEIDDIEHLCSAEFEISNVFHVTDEETGEDIAEVPMKDDMIASLVNPFEHSKTWKKKNKVVVYGQSFEKGGFPFETIETDEPFDASKLKANCTEWDGLKMIHSITYDGNEYCCEGGDTTGKSMAVWIDD